MRTKALILGALPKPPFESEWLFIGEADRWNVRTVCSPTEVVLSGEIELEIESRQGYLYQVPITQTPLEISGRKVRATIVREIQDIKTISVVLETNYV